MPKDILLQNKPNYFASNNCSFHKEGVFVGNNLVHILVGNRSRSFANFDHNLDNSFQTDANLERSRFCMQLNISFVCLHYQSMFNQIFCPTFFDLEKTFSNGCNFKMSCVIMMI